ncbi:MAG: hypothetical protein M0Z70_02955 [Nitrospiraceae bacterium]|jgi:hypothetical protein|nr:hypothetical protein [Nitrospirota bacterium]MDA8338244.1 hypothetical protein [Nitrospiraceae bacterium]
MPKKDYSKYSKEELIKIIKNLEKHRYGLVWEEEHEKEFEIPFPDRIKKY